MLKIINENIKVNSHYYDYQLENGTLLHKNLWNGENYYIKIDNKEFKYTPIYSQKENENGSFDIIGFVEKIYNC